MGRASWSGAPEWAGARAMVISRRLQQAYSSLGAGGAPPAAAGCVS